MTLKYVPVWILLLIAPLRLLSQTQSQQQVSLGRYLFAERMLSENRDVSCSSCHLPDRAYSDPKPRSIGTAGKVGTRNAPSLLGIADDSMFFWDGRRARLDEAVMDPLTNPAELGLSSIDEAIVRLRRLPKAMAMFRATFPHESQTPTRDQIQQSLTQFVRSLTVRSSLSDAALRDGAKLSREAEQGRRLFDGIAGCSQCHSIPGIGAGFSDGHAHYSDIGASARTSRLAELAREVVSNKLTGAALGQKILSSREWSELGRFVVTYSPEDIGTFRTPSLRNVALTAPYMHDGSIASLSEAVNHELYYHSIDSHRPMNFSASEREAIVAFLGTLTDTKSDAAASKVDLNRP